MELAAFAPIIVHAAKWNPAPVAGIPTCLSARAAAAELALKLPHSNATFAAYAALAESMSLSAVFLRFDNFMVMFVAMFAVVWSSVFMPLLGGPLHTYEARAIGAGWQSLQTGQAASIAEAFNIAASFPAEAVFPSAHAAPVEVAMTEPEPGPLQLLGGPDVEFPTLPRLASAHVVSTMSVAAVSVACEAQDGACRQALADS